MRRENLSRPSRMLRILIGTGLIFVALISGWSSANAQSTTAGTINVIVSLNVPYKLDSRASAAQNRAALKSLQPSFAQARSTIMADLAGYHAVEYAGRDWIIPSIALRVDQAALDHLKKSPLVKSISPDHALKVADAASDTQIGAQNVWNAGFAGLGQDVAILDTGVQEDHPFLGGRVTAEACFSGNGSTATTLCPNGQPSQFGAGAAAYCSASTECDHGTHVAGIAAGNGFYSGGPGYGGVAIQSSIIAVQVFSNAGSGNITAYDTDIISGLSWVYNNRASFSVAAINLSLGDGNPYPSTCDDHNQSMADTITNLRAVGIATVVAAGNGNPNTGIGYPNDISYPACISSAISVGAIDNSDNPANFTNRGPKMSIYAPGVNVSSSVPGSSYAVKSGTSMAAPQVTGALAVLRSYDPAISVDQMQRLISNTGKLIFSSDSGLNQPRLQMDQAYKVMFPAPKTIGVYRNNVFLLRSTNSIGYADAGIAFGAGSNLFPIVGDWTGSGIDRLGIYNQANGTFSLCLTPGNVSCSSASGSSLAQFALGTTGDYPIAGFWNPRATYSGATLISYAVEGAGVFRPTNGILYLKNQLSSGYADNAMVLGIPGDQGIAGDWDGDGQGSPGVYRPSSAVFYLSNQVTNGAVFADISFTYGDGYNDEPVAGNWLGSPSSYGLGPGIYRTGTGFFMLRNTLSTGFADNSFFYGIASDLPVVGTWGNLSGPIAPRGSTQPPSILVPNLTPAPQNNSVPGSSQIGG